MTKSKFVTEKEYADKILELTASVQCTGPVKPERFKRKIWENRGVAAAFSDMPLPANGLERRNPLIVALGDSVTAGHFEFAADPAKLGGKSIDELLSSGQIPEGMYEICDVRECFSDKFRALLVEKYEWTPVTVINSGIAGDTVHGMLKRLDRDVIRYDPDLILINGSLNWFENCGSIKDYEDDLREIVVRCRAETEADIVLLTPNYALPTPMDHPEVTLAQRVDVIRKIAAEQQVCFVDVYLIWETYKDMGYPVKKLLANGANHPSVTGHEVYAKALMKLFR